MITDDQIGGLPEDPEVAFVEFERIVRSRLYEYETRGSRENYYNSDFDRRNYISQAIGAASEFGIGNIAQWNVPSVSDNIGDAYLAFVSDVDQYTIKLRLRHAPRTRQNSVGLDGNAKTKIHHYIEQIKTAIEEAGLPDTKRDSLYGKLNRFVLEVDQSRTSLQAGMAIYIEVCNGIGQGFNGLEPVKRFIDSIAALLGRAKQAEDSLRPLIGRFEPRKELEAPRRGSVPPDTSDGKSDDEIPF